MGRIEEKGRWVGGGRDSKGRVDGKEITEENRDGRKAGMRHDSRREGNKEMELKV